MGDNESIIIRVDFDTEKVAAKMSEATKRVAELKEQQKELRKEMEKGGEAAAEAAKKYAANAAEIEANNRTIKSSIALLQSETMARLDDNASLDDQRQALNAAQKAYAQLSGAEKEAADAAGGLRDQIARLSDRVKQQEAAIGDARRNVGNYAMQTAEAAGKMGFFGQGLQGVVNPIKNVTAGLKAASATPFLAIVSVLITLLQKLGDRFKGNAAAMEKLTGIFGAFSGVTNIVNTLIDKLADGLGWIAEKAFELADKLGIVSDKMKEARAIAVEDLEIQKAQQEAALKTAEDQRRIAELKAQAAEKDKLTEKERLALLQEAADLEEGISKRTYELAKREYELQVQRNAQSDSTVEDLKKENDLRIAMINAETALFNKRKELNGQMAELRKKDVADAKTENTELIRERELLVERTMTELEKEIAGLEKARAKELEIAGLTTEEKLQIQDYYDEQIRERREAANREALEDEAKKLQARLDARAQFGLDPEKSPEEKELEMLQQAREQDLLNDEEYEIAKTMIQQKYSEIRQNEIEESVRAATALYEQEMKSAASGAGAAMNALGDLVGAFADDSEEAAKAQKAFALGSILINQAMSIAEGAKGIAAAMAGAAEAAAATGPAAPIMFAVYQAQMVGQVLAVVASVASTIAQAKQLFSEADAGNFANGGTIQGTSYTGDKLIAHVNSGEGIYTGTQANNILQRIANSPLSGGNTQELAAAIADVMKDVHPTLVYEEFKTFEREVAEYDELAKI